ncbi:MAG TPA: DUF4333 domain-containing protein [Acidimicrobiales bacterium]|jgi:hypothetical protein|nr:DUF4333 domain-containing protein [Acidimicrobiales bacterium]
MKFSLWRRASLGGCVSIGLLSVACVSAGASVGTVPQNVVQTQAAKVLASETGQPPPTVKCPGGLNAKVGAHITCKLTSKGSKLVYPVVVTVNRVANGTAHFNVQVGQAPGQANKAKFCADNAAIEKATSSAKTSADLIAAFSANQNTILDFQKVAPAEIVAQAAKLVQAARLSVNTNSTKPFMNTAVEKAGVAVDKFCGVSDTP